MDKSLALISVRVYAHAGLDDLRTVLVRTTKCGKPENVSSVYKIKHQGEARMRFGRATTTRDLEGFIMVFDLRTDWPASELLELLVQLEKEIQKSKQHRAMNINLLAYDELVVTMPQMTLPHPELHLRPEELVPAAEVWPTYRHPVLKQTFHELAIAAQTKDWGEFYSQGRALLDFSTIHE